MSASGSCATSRLGPIRSACWGEADACCCRGSLLKLQVMSAQTAIRPSNSLLIRAASLFCRENSLFRGKNSLLVRIGNSPVSH
jgi:hypothetical protein